MNTIQHPLPIQVKVCGITNEADAIEAAKLGANYIGFILNYPNSPRYITVTKAGDIIRTVKILFPDVQFVGVFVDANSETIQAVADQLDLDIVQLHGNEDLDTILTLRQVAVWKTVELQTEADLERIHYYDHHVQMIHLDAGKGSGKVIPAELLQALPTEPAYILAGGISPSNVLERLAVCKPAARPTIVDVNSGVETIPGKKDAELLKQLFTELTNYTPTNEDHV